jgi:hypothetical protein
MLEDNHIAASAHQREHPKSIAYSGRVGRPDFTRRRPLRRVSH